MARRRRVLILLLGGILVLGRGAPTLGAQTPASGPAPATPAGPTTSAGSTPDAPTPAAPVDNRITELQTAGYYELVDRAREAGLDPSGGVPELRARIAQAWGLTLPAATPAGKQTLTVDSAQEAGLVTVEAPGDGKLLRLSGGLKVTLVDNEKKVTHVIEAGELWYDQANEELTARGGVLYTMLKGTSKEVFRGDSLTFRLSDSQGIFYGGASDRNRSVGTQSLTFRYAGQAVRRSGGDLVVLDDGTITSSLGADPYYRIEAKKIWVLAPGEWGLKDAVLYVGRVPLFYFPFFFQPGDDFLFNPVLSFPNAGDRRGTSLQTTTYFFGKKTRDSAPLSFLRFDDAQADDDTRVPRGLFLVRGTPSDSPVPPTWTLKYLADFYSNLGFLTAVQASLPGLGGLKSLTGLVGLGVTRTVGSDGMPFSTNPFQSLVDPGQQSDWNGSWLGSIRLPFRWGGNFALDAGWANLSLEYYSDPLLYADLTGNRSENFNMFSFLGLGATKQTVAASTKASLQWAGNVNVSPLTLGVGLLWDTATTSPAGPDGDPENSYYRPTQLTLPQATLSLSGTLWPWPQAKAAPGASDPAGTLHPPSDLGPAAAPPSAPGTPAAEAGPAGAVEDQLTAPARLDPLTLATSATGWTSGLTWSLKPTVKTDTRFDTTQGTSPSQPLNKVLTSQWSGSYDGKLTLTTGTADGVLSTSDTLSLHQQAQDTWYQGPSVTDAQAASYSALDKAQTSSLLSQALTSTWKPFTGPFRDSNLQYSLGTNLWKATADDSAFFDGTKDTVTTHQVNTVGVWYLTEGNPTLKAQSGLQTTLPPLDPLRTWTGSLELTTPWAKASTKTSAKQTSTALTWDPWESSAEWTPLTDLSFKESYQYDLQAAKPLVSTTTAAAWGWTAQYRAQQTLPYEFDTVNKAWVVSGSQAFLPQELRFGYTLDLPAVQWWYHRHTLSSKVNLSWPINLQQYSQMPLTLNYTVTYKLARFLDFQVTEGIVNRTAYRYFPALVDSFGPGLVTPVNPLADLWDSISVWDPAALKRTGFKMTTLSLSLVHYLEDWQIKLDYSGSPQLVASGLTSTYQWQGTLSLLVQWNPVPELKTQMVWDKNGDLTIPKNGS